MPYLPYRRALCAAAASHPYRGAAVVSRRLTRSASSSKPESVPARASPWRARLPCVAIVSAGSAPSRARPKTSISQPPARRSRRSSEPRADRGHGARPPQPARHLRAARVSRRERPTYRTFTAPSRSPHAACIQRRPRRSLRESFASAWPPPPRRSPSTSQLHPPPSFPQHKRRERAELVERVGLVRRRSPQTYTDRRETTRPRRRLRARARA